MIALRWLFILFFFFVCESTAKDASASIESGRVLSLANTNFTALISEGNWFVEFFAPWCQHCKKFEPEWKEIAYYIRDGPMKIATVDCEAQPELRDRFHVSSYPTFILFQNAKPSVFRGKRTLHHLMAFATFTTRHQFTSYFPEWKLQPPLSPIRNPQEDSDVSQKSSECASPEKKELKRQDKEKKRKERGEISERIGRKSVEMDFDHFDTMVIKKSQTETRSAPTETFLLNFFSSACPDCIQIDNQWRELSKRFSERYPVKKTTLTEHPNGQEYVENTVFIEWPVIFVHIDCFIEYDLCSRYDISTFPTLRLVHRGMIYHYSEKDFELASIISYLNKYLASFLREWEEKNNQSLAQDTTFSQHLDSRDLFEQNTKSSDQKVALNSMKQEL